MATGDRQSLCSHNFRWASEQIYVSTLVPRQELGKHFKCLKTLISSKNRASISSLPLWKRMEEKTRARLSAIWNECPCAKLSIAVSHLKRWTSKPSLRATPKSQLSMNSPTQTCLDPKTENVIRMFWRS